MKKFPKPWYRPSRGLWFVTLDGKQINLGPDRQQAFQQYAQLLAQPQTRDVPSDSLVGVIDAFLDWVQKHRSADTYEWYRYRLQRFAEKYPNLRMGELKPYHVQQWIDGYSDLSRTSRRNYARTVKRCCKWATLQGYASTNPVQHLEIPSADRREFLITPQDYERLVSLIREEGFQELVKLTWDTGCRPQESLRVEARHVDLPRQRWVFPTEESKGKRQPRILYLSETATEITRRRMARYPVGPLFRNACGRPWTTDAVNCQFDRLRVRLLQAQGLIDPERLEAEIKKLMTQLNPLTTRCGQSVKKTLRQLREEARRKLLAQYASQKVPRYSLYALRHAWATRALQSGLDGLTVAILMGHSDPSTLAKVYQHLAHQPEHLLAQARRAAGG